MLTYLRVLAIFSFMIAHKFGKCKDATVLFSVVALSLRLLFRGVSRFPGFPSDTLFLRQCPVLPRFLRAVPHVVRGGWGRGGFPVWIGGVHSLICGFTGACILTCQNDS